MLRQQTVQFFHLLFSVQVAEVAINSAAEACWYFASSREQFRISGELSIVDGDSRDEAMLVARQAAWAGMSDAGRVQFSWPAPRAPRNDDPLAFSGPAPGPQVNKVWCSTRSKQCTIVFIKIQPDMMFSFSYKYL